MAQGEIVKPHRFVMGLDLGQAQDFSALSVVEIVKPPPLKWHDLQRPQPTKQHLRYLHRFPLGTPYPEIVQHSMYRRGQLDSGTSLVVDATGVGLAVVDMFALYKMPLVAVTITGGNKVNREPGTIVDHWNVPKRELVIGLQVALQKGEFLIAGGLKDDRDGKLFYNELLKFKVKIDPKTAHDSYGAAREGDHDDLVLSVALASWYAGRTQVTTSNRHFNSTAR